MKPEIRPVKLVDNKYEECDASDPDVTWALYAKSDDGRLMHVKDFAGKAQAEHGAELLKLFIEAVRGRQTND